MDFQIDREDLQRFPVLRDGAAGDHDALLAEDSEIWLSRWFANPPLLPAA
jgi:hypothetical protein